MEFSNNQDVISLIYGSMLPENLPNILTRSDLRLRMEADNIVIYKGRDSRKHGKKRNKECEKNLEKRKYTGRFSESARRFVSKRLRTWLECIHMFNESQANSGKRRKAHPVFLTLTLPAQQQHSDQEIKRKILVPFIDKLIYHFELKHYFWRAEKQKNGNIHFHLILDSYLTRELVWRLWRDCVDKLDYYKRFRENNPTGKGLMVWINSSSSFDSLVAYLMKYCLKIDPDEQVDGKLWGMSSSIRHLQGFTSDNLYMILLLWKKISDLAGFEVFENEHFISIRVPQGFDLRNSSLPLVNDYQQFMFLVYDLLYGARHKEDSWYKAPHSVVLDSCNEKSFDKIS